MTSPSKDEAEQQPDAAATSVRRGDSSRARMNAPVALIIEDSQKNRICGTGTLKNLSLQGALITDLRIESGPELDPDISYTLKFKLMAGLLAGMEATCQSVRFDPNTRGFGVRLPNGFKLPIV